MSSFKDLENLYGEIILEKAGHSMKDVMLILKDAIKKGLVDLEEKKNGFMVKSRIDSSQFLIHKGEGGLHDLRRYLQKLEKLSS